MATVLSLHKTSLLVGVVTFAYAAIVRRERLGARSLCVAFLLLTVGSTVAGWGEMGILAWPSWRLFTLVIGAVAYGALWIGLAEFETRRVRARRWLVMIYPVVLTGVALATGFDADNATRAAVFNLTAVAAYAMSARAMAVGYRHELLPARLLLSAVLAIQGVTHLATVLGVLGLYDGYPRPVDAFMIAIVMNFAIAVAVILLAQERVARELVDMATVDVLTGAYNRRHFFAVTPARCAAGDAALLVDVDHFKAINDGHGHAVGDLVLKAIAGRIRDAIPDPTRHARLGGEEFVVFVPAAGPERAMALAERIRAAVAVPAPAADGLPPRITVSIGVAVSAADGEALDQLVVEADRALYDAKRAGRNRCVLAGAWSDVPPPEHAADGSVVRRGSRGI